MFSEKQRFPKWFSWLILSPLMLTIGILIFISTTEESDKNEVIFVLFIVMPLQLIMFLLFYRSQLEKVVTTNGMYYRWTPLQKKYRVIEKEEIGETELRRSPLLKLGSNWMPGYGRIHSASHGEGVQIFKTNGKKIFFSAADPASFRKALEVLVMSNRKIHWREF